jgi:hypothetical protein
MRLRPTRITADPGKGAYGLSYPGAIHCLPQSASMSVIGADILYNVE